MLCRRWLPQIQRSLVASMSSSSAYHQLFDTQAEAYSNFRPGYSQELYDVIYEYSGLQGKGELAVDIATGSGQAAQALAARFDRVVGIDANDQQLGCAKRRPNIEYAVGDAHATGLADSCADLVTVAQALHWFDIPRFYTEAARILKPGGTLAAWTYDICTINGADSAATRALHAFCSGRGEGQLGPYWSDRRALVDRRYAGLEPSSSSFSHCELRQLSMQTRTSLAQLMGYLASWSALGTYRRRHPGLPDPLQAFQPELLAAVGTTDLGHLVQVDWPLALILAKGPAK